MDAGGADRAYLGRHRFQVLGEELLIWKMPRFDLSRSEVKNHMRLVEKHKPLILDLRGNPGGAVETLEAMVGSFLEGEVKVGDVESRERMNPIVGRAAGDAWKGKLIVLVTPEDIAAGRDPVLAHAASLCGVTLDPEKAGSFFPVEMK